MLYLAPKHIRIVGFSVGSSDSRALSSGIGPPSPNATVMDILEFGYVGGQVPIYRVMDPPGGLMCYRYDLTKPYASSWGT